ncbi:hypothetical protein JCM6882_004804 [Rhodosporidiobolus microsporus]
MADAQVAPTDPQLAAKLASRLAALERAVALLRVALGPLKEDPQRHDDADDACEELNDFACASSPAPWSEVEPLLKRIYFVGGEDAGSIAPRLFCDAFGIGLAHKTLMKVQVTSDDSSLRMLFVLRRLIEAVNLRRSQVEGERVQPVEESGLGVGLPTATAEEEQAAPAFYQTAQPDERKPHPRKIESSPAPEGITRTPSPVPSIRDASDSSSPTFSGTMHHPGSPPPQHVTGRRDLPPPRWQIADPAPQPAAQSAPASPPRPSPIPATPGAQAHPVQTAPRPVAQDASALPAHSGPTPPPAPTPPTPPLPQPAVQAARAPLAAPAPRPAAQAVQAPLAPSAPRPEPQNARAPPASPAPRPVAQAQTAPAASPAAQAVDRVVQPPPAPAARGLVAQAARTPPAPPAPEADRAPPPPRPPQAAERVAQPPPAHPAPPPVVPRAALPAAAARPPAPPSLQRLASQKATNLYDQIRGGNVTSMFLPSVPRQKPRHDSRDVAITGAAHRAPPTPSSSGSAPSSTPRSTLSGLARPPRPASSSSTSAQKAAERPAERVFHPLLRQTWFDASLTRPPPADLPLSHDGLPVWEVPFTRQVPIKPAPANGRVRHNDIGGNSQYTLNANCQLLCYSGDRQELPKQIGEMFCVGEGLGVKYLKRIRNAGRCSVFHSHGVHDWRYGGDLKEHKRYFVEPADFRSMSSKRLRLWERYFDRSGAREEFGLEHTGSGAGAVEFIKTERTTRLVFAAFRVVGYDRGRIREWLDNHETSAGWKAIAREEAAARQNKAKGVKPAKASSEGAKKASETRRKKRPREDEWRENEDETRSDNDQRPALYEGDDSQDDCEEVYREFSPRKKR